MSNYKSGDKFVIELGEQVGNLWKIKGFNALVFDNNGLDRLGRLVQGVDQFSYNKGANDAWKLLGRMYFELTGGELKEIFKRNDCVRAFDEVLKNETYQFAAAKVEAWEKKKEAEKIKPGDVVDVYGAGLALVVGTDDCGAHVMFSDGKIEPYTYGSMKKTGQGIWNLVGYEKA